MSFPRRITWHDGRCMEHSIQVDGSEMIVWLQTFFPADYADESLRGKPVLEHSTWCLTARIDGNVARVVDYFEACQTLDEARQHAAWALSQWRARTGDEFIARRQLELPGTRRAG